MSEPLRMVRRKARRTLLERSAVAKGGNRGSRKRQGPSSGSTADAVVNQENYGGLIILPVGYPRRSLAVLSHLHQLVAHLLRRRPLEIGQSRLRQLTPADAIRLYGFAYPVSYEYSNITLMKMDRHGCVARSSKHPDWRTRTLRKSGFRVIDDQAWRMSSIRI